MNPFLKGFLAVLILAGLSGASYAEANQTVIQGVTPNGQGMTLPRSLCAYPGQAIRIGAMVIDYGGRPFLRPNGSTGVSSRPTETRSIGALLGGRYADLFGVTRIWNGRFS